MTITEDDAAAGGRADAAHHEVRRPARAARRQARGDPHRQRPRGLPGRACSRRAVDHGRRCEDADVETSSDAYARRFAGAVGAWFLDVQARTTLDLLAPWPGARVLDVGGGHGQLAGPLLDAGHEVTVVGSAPACGDRVRPLVDAGRARFQAGDLLRAALAGPRVRRRARLPPAAPRRATGASWWPSCAGWPRRAVIVDYPTRRSVNAVAGRAVRR